MSQDKHGFVSAHQNRKHLPLQPQAQVIPSSSTIMILTRHTIHDPSQHSPAQFISSLFLHNLMMFIKLNAVFVEQEEFIAQTKQ